jgi:hypothetical protein
LKKLGDFSENLTFEFYEWHFEVGKVLWEWSIAPFWLVDYVMEDSPRSLLGILQARILGVSMGIEVCMSAHRFKVLPEEIVNT